MQLGMFFTGCSPGGGASNIWTVALGGNLDLSITMTAISTFASFGESFVLLFLEQTIAINYLTYISLILYKATMQILFCNDITVIDTSSNLKESFSIMCVLLNNRIGLPTTTLNYVAAEFLDGAHIYQ